MSDFDDWYKEIEGYGLRGERAAEELGLKGEKAQRLGQWLAAAFCAGQVSGGGGDRPAIPKDAMALMLMKGGSEMGIIIPKMDDDPDYEWPPAWTMLVEFGRMLADEPQELMEFFGEAIARRRGLDGEATLQ